MKIFKRMKRMKQTFTGTPIQFMKWSESKGNWQILPAVISFVDRNEIALTVIGDKRNQVIPYVRHADFKKIGFDYWDFIPNNEGGQNRNVIYPGDVS